MPDIQNDINGQIVYKCVSILIGNTSLKLSTGK